MSVAEEELVADSWVPVAQAMRYSGIGRTRLYELMAGNELPYSQVGHKRLIPLAALKRLLLSNLRGDMATSNG